MNGEISSKKRLSQSLLQKQPSNIMFFTVFSWLDEIVTSRFDMIVKSKIPFSSQINDYPVP